MNVIQAELSSKLPPLCTPQFLDVLKTRLSSMQEWKERLDGFLSDKRIAHWMSFEIEAYIDIIYASQAGDLSIDYSNDESGLDAGVARELFNREVSVKKTAVFEEMGKLKHSLETAKKTFQEKSPTISVLLNRTINDAQMLIVSIELKHPIGASQMHENNNAYLYLEREGTELFRACEVLVKARDHFSHMSFEIIAHICHIQSLMYAKDNR